MILVSEIASLLISETDMGRAGFCCIMQGKVKGIFFAGQGTGTVEIFFLKLGAWSFGVWSGAGWCFVIGCGS